MEEQNILKHLRVSLGTDCNESCWYCFREGIMSEKPFLDSSRIEHYHWLLGILVTEFRLENVRFTGGEPLLNPEIHDIIKVTSQVGIKNIGVTTNGILLLDNYNKLYKKEMIDYAIHITTIDHVHYGRLDETLKFINELKEQIRNFRINLVVTRKNIKEVKEIINYCLENNIDILLLDLLKSKNMDKEIFLHNYYNLNCLDDFISSKYNTKTIFNDNICSYSNSKCRIRVVMRYKDALNNLVYCTKNLSMHPLLLTSDFSLIICNHFGIDEIKISDYVLERNVEEIINKIRYAIGQLHSCNDCSNIHLLND